MAKLGSTSRLTAELWERDCWGQDRTLCIFSGIAFQ